MATQNMEKPIHSVIIDTGPLIRNTISISTIINSAEVIYTTPAIIAEIRDPATRSRVETTLLPFLNIKTPSPASYEAVAAFAKKTGDFSVLSRQDLGILALAYEVHCEKHGGPWGLRSVPKGPLNLKPEEQAKVAEEAAKKKAEKEGDEQKELGEVAAETRQHDSEPAPAVDSIQQETPPTEASSGSDLTMPEPADDPVTYTQSQHQPGGEFVATGPAAVSQELPQNDTTGALPQQDSEQTPLMEPSRQVAQPSEEPSVEATSSTTLPTEEEVQDSLEDVRKDLEEVQVSDASPWIVQASPEKNIRKKKPNRKERLARRAAEQHALATSEDPVLPSASQQPTPPATSSDDSDGGEWITPSNLSAHRAKDASTVPLRSEDEPQIPVAIMTTDYAMQNVLLQLNMHLLSPAMQRIRNVRTTILRCHACFLTTREMSKQFCPRCGQPALQRVSCSTNAKGEFQIHLSKKYQYNNRGNKYSIPKPVAGTSNGKLNGKGGGKGGWGRELVLSEDQKEYQRQVGEGKRRKERDLMDEDFLPGILTGERARDGGRPKVGAGRHINSKKRF